MFHPGEKAVQIRAGVDAADWGSAGVGGTVPPIAAEFLQAQVFVVISAADRSGALWTTQLTGEPGFVHAAAEDEVHIRAVPPPTDPLHDALNATSSTEPADVGLIALEPSTRRRMRVNGTAHRDGDRMIVRTEQVYSNCPKYIQTRRPRPLLTPQRSRPIRHESHDLTQHQRSWLSRADTFFIGTASPHLGLDASHRGGNPGFVHVDGSRLSWPDYVGNSMYMTLGNLELDSRAGLLFLDWEQGHSLHLSGRARIDWSPSRAAGTPGAQRHIDFDLDRVVQVDHSTPLTWTFEKYSRFNPH
ncbi:pyridoxamine 5'-phosphate oxidase family protein [Phytoactinopolyspora halotolerans]|uniref:Oxidoreductase n=1 Tax=Phytoactinopolyspora halotolerans TaxID=1981512 RepID=A0A6L9S7M3_9ACTN|nr:pyridoxamine 5'-phosphate oxidase family protein [Phytoactinopolyspora halotolerans]NEE01007.1 oxidoreductase [Phytoactinopolyspora halotolerans]